MLATFPIFRNLRLVDGRGCREWDGRYPRASGDCGVGVGDEKKDEHGRLSSKLISFPSPPVTPTFHPAQPTSYPPSEPASTTSGLLLSHPPFHHLSRKHEALARMPSQTDPSTSSSSQQHLPRDARVIALILASKVSEIIVFFSEHSLIS